MQLETKYLHRRGQRLFPARRRGSTRVRMARKCAGVGEIRRAETAAGRRCSGRDCRNAQRSGRGDRWISAREGTPPETCQGDVPAARSHDTERGGGKARDIGEYVEGLFEELGAT